MGTPREMTTDLARIEHFAGALAPFVGDERSTLEYEPLDDVITFKVSPERCRKYFTDDPGIHALVSTKSGEPVGIIVHGASSRLKRHRERLGNALFELFSQIMERMPVK